MPIVESGWHSGDGTNGSGNRESVGIEICEVNGAEETAQSRALYQDPPTLEFFNMDATTTGKDGEGITQIQAETQSTYTDNNWDFVNVWYMGLKYPLLR